MISVNDLNRTVALLKTAEHAERGKAPRDADIELFVVLFKKKKRAAEVFDVESITINDGAIQINIREA